MKYKGVIFLIVGAFALSFWSIKVLSYSPYYTHPDLTEEMAKLFNNINKNEERKISGQEIKWMRQGAIEEDEPARWINHFYDPTTGKGWTGSRFGNLTSEEGLKTVADIAAREPIPSINWVTNQDYQSAYGRQFGNQTWQKAIKAYADGDKKTAFIALGHVMHLVEDMSVPDHTRDDTHADMKGDPGSPYERYSENYTNFNKLKFAENLKNSEFFDYSDISSLMRELANYTNSNFFSEDTINDPAYKLPDINSVQEIYKIINGKERKFLSNEGIILAMENNPGSFIMGDTNYVLPSYVENLMPKAVLYGASAINLFFDEVDKYKKSGEEIKITRDTNVPFKQALAAAPKLTALKIYNTYESTKNSALIALNNSLNYLPTRLSTNLRSRFFPQPAVSQKNPQLTSNNVETPKKSEPIPVVSPKPPVIIARTSTTTPVKIQPVPKKIIPRPKPVSTPVAEPPVVAPIISSSSTINSSSPISVPTYALGGGGPQGISGVGGSPEPSAEEQAPHSDTIPPSAPISDESFTNTIYTTSTSVVIFGTVSTDTVAIFASSSPVQESPIEISLSTFSLIATLNSGHNYFSFTATDANNNTSSNSSEAHFVYDITAPTVPILTIDNQSGASSTNINVALQSTDDSPLYFDLQVTTNTLDWLDLLINTSTSEFNFSGDRGAKYFFRARARDILQNESDWSAATNASYINYSGEIVINEIAWAGTSASAFHEWIELYNNSDENIDLGGWQVLVNGRALNWSKINTTTIPARGYYLYERTNDNTIKNVTADYIFYLDGGISNGGAKVELIKPDGSKADEVDASSGWFAGDNVYYRTMERRSHAVSGNDATNWQSNQGFRIGPQTKNNGQIYGSPKMPNFGYITLNYAQDEAIRTLTKENSPYYLEFYEIPAGKTLQIEPGVVIWAAYQASNMLVNGTLNAEGNAEEKIIFTTSKESYTTTTAKDWQGIWFKSGSSGNLAGVEFKYAGYPFRLRGNLPQNTEQAIRIEGANVQISGSDFNDNGSLVIYSENSDLTFNNSTFANGVKAIETNGSAVNISNSTFDNFSDGSGPFIFRDQLPNLKNISFVSTTDMVSLERMTVSDGSAGLSGGKYQIRGSMTVASSSILTVDAGAQIYLTQYSYMDIQGSLDAQGTAENPVEFLAMSTSSQWGNLRFNNSTSTLNYVNIKNGNRLNGRSENLNGMLIVENSNLEINNAELWDAEFPGNTIQSTNSSLTIKNSRIGAESKREIGGPTTMTRGVKINSGILNLDNVNFENLNIGIAPVTSNSPIINVQNISSQNFVNVDYSTDPPGLINFASST